MPAREGVSRQTSRTDYRLPAQATTGAGHPYVPQRDHWIIPYETGHANFRFADLRALSPVLIDAFKGALMSKLRTHSVRGAHFDYEAGLWLLRHLARERPGAEAIRLADLMNYLASLPTKRRSRSTRAHRLIRYWVELGLPGIEDAAFEFAKESERYYDEKGRSVRTMDPRTGAYSDLEYNGLRTALHAAYAAGEIKHANYAICLLSLSIAPRPSQIALLKVRDLTVTRRQDGSKVYILAVPRVKQRREGPRSDLRVRELIPEVGAILERQAHHVREVAIAAGIGEPDDAPMFPSPVGRGFSAAALASVREHSTRDGIRDRLKHTIRLLKVRSERTGELIKATAHRCRRTLGTRAAEEGHGPLIIADLLDHTDTQNVMVYIETRPEVLRRLDRAFASALAPLAQRFAGVIRERDSDESENGIRDVCGVVADRGQPEAIGGCTRRSHCALTKPIACYTCRLFRPWLDGPHEALLESLLRRRERVASKGSLRVAAANDQAILAVAEVVEKCHEMRSALKASSDG